MNLLLFTLLSFVPTLNESVTVSPRAGGIFPDTDRGGPGRGVSGGCYPIAAGVPEAGSE